MKKKIKRIKKMNMDFREQIKCIVHNLKKSNVVHLDVLDVNMTIDNKGTLGLIDYNMAIIDKKITTSQLRHRFNKIDGDYNTEDQFLEIIEENFF